MCPSKSRKGSGGLDLCDDVEVCATEDEPSDDEEVDAELEPLPNFLDYQDKYVYSPAQAMERHSLYRPTFLIRLHIRPLPRFMPHRFNLL